MAAKAAASMVMSLTPLNNSNVSSTPIEATMSGNVPSRAVLEDEVSLFRLD